MLKPITTNQFEKDIKLAKMRGKELDKIFIIMVFYEPLRVVLKIHQ